MKSNHTDTSKKTSAATKDVSTTATTIAQEVPKKRRGRVKGTKNGPRTLHFAAFAVGADGNNILDDITFEKYSSEPSVEDAKKMFMEKHDGLEPDVLGPFWKKNTPGGAIARKKEFLDLSIDKLEMTGERVKGEYDGWNVVGFKIKGHPEYVQVVIGEKVNSDDKRKSHPRNDRPVPLSKIKNLQNLS